MWGAPHSGFSRLSVRINWRTCLGAAGRPRLPWRIFQLQNRPKPFRCQPITVAALTNGNVGFPAGPDGGEPAQSPRSAGLKLRAAESLRRTPDWLDPRGVPEPIHHLQRAASETNPEFPFHLLSRIED